MGCWNTSEEVHQTHLQASSPRSVTFYVHSAFLSGFFFGGGGWQVVLTTEDQEVPAAFLSRAWARMDRFFGWLRLSEEAV